MPAMSPLVPVRGGRAKREHLVKPAVDAVAKKGSIRYGRRVDGEPNAASTSMGNHRGHEGASWQRPERVHPDDPGAGKVNRVRQPRHIGRLHIVAAGHPADKHVQSR